MYILDEVTLNVCTGDAVKAWRLIGRMLVVIKIAVPIILVIMGSIDLMKAVMAGREDDIKKNQVMFVKRAIAGVIVFFIPTIVSLILTTLLGQEKDSCVNCVLDTSTCNVTESNN